MSTMFAPPTGPPIKYSTLTPPPDATPGPAPRGRRRPVVLATAVVAVAALGVGAFAAVTGGPSDAGNQLAQPFSLIAAAEDAVDARTVDFELTTSAGDVGEVTISGTVDNETELMSITTDLSSLMGLGDTALPMGDAAMQILVDGENGIVYLDASSFGGLLASDATWVSIDVDELAARSGQELDDLSGGLGIDPTEIATLLLDTDDAVEVGSEVIDGVDTMRYEVTIDISSALDALPQADLDAEFGDLDPADLDLPDTVTYDVWVTADNQLRRVAFDLEVAGQSIAMQLDMTTSNDALGIELPADADVFELTELLGF